MSISCSLFPKSLGTNLEAPSPCPEQQQHSGSPFLSSTLVTSRDQKGVMEIAGKWWSQGLTQILFLSLPMPHPPHDLSPQCMVTI